MKELKLPKKNIIILSVLIGIFFVAGIVFLVLPDDVYYATGDPNPDVGRYFWFVTCEILALIVLIKTLRFVSKMKPMIEYCNTIRRQAGENAYFVGGYCKVIDPNNTAAIRTAISVLGEIASAVIFGWGIYKVSSQNTSRLFLLCDDGLYIICSLQREHIFLKKGCITTATLAKNIKGQIELTCPNENFVLTFDTLKIDITSDELTQKLQTLFFNDEATVE